MFLLGLHWICTFEGQQIPMCILCVPHVLPADGNLASDFAAKNIMHSGVLMCVSNVTGSGDRLIEKLES